MSPEFIDSGKITFKSDIYSLGIIITEILTGQKWPLQIENVRIFHPRRMIVHTHIIILTSRVTSWHGLSGQIFEKIN